MEARRWTEVMDIGDDQALFVSAICSKAVRLPDNRHGFLRGNRVFIVGSDLGKRYCSCGVYDMSNGRFSTIVVCSPDHVAAMTDYGILLHLPGVPH
uniref:KIB1-4 beta-propeller domain-containing protein n=1 Tax=Oryza punctata TaxID=4537 RepID=A0A0E0MCK9_ORYPU